MTQSTKRLVQRIKLEKPSISDNTADAERLVQTVSKRFQNATTQLDFGLLPGLGTTLRDADYQIDCLLCRDKRGYQIIGVGNPITDFRPLGVALDLGTTRLVVRLVDLAKANTLQEATFDNPQCSIGPDILTRIHFAHNRAGLAQLQRMLLDEINDQVQRLCQDQQRVVQDVFLYSIAGNTAMSHLLLGLEPRWIIREPYIPLVNTPGLIEAKHIGLLGNQCARAFVFPNVGSYFGGDLLAGILYSGMTEQDHPMILVDVGTNAEVVLGNRDWLIGCAGAAGPALEAGVAEIGMVAKEGVIDRIWVNPQTRAFEYHTIGDKPPIGICGSGLIDLAAALYLASMIDVRGRLVPDRCGRSLREVDGVRQLVLVPKEQSATGEDLVIDQHGLTSLKKAKAAMFTILETLTLAVGLGFEQLHRFNVAGTFGSVIDPRSAITIGMLPDLALQRFCVLGNSSVQGASMVFDSLDRIGEIDAIRDRITYMELNVNQDFMNRFSAAQFFPHTNRSRFPSVQRWSDQSQSG